MKGDVQEVLGQDDVQEKVILFDCCSIKAVQGIIVAETLAPKLLSVSLEGRRERGEARKCQSACLICTAREVGRAHRWRSTRKEVEGEAEKKGEGAGWTKGE